MVPPSPRTSAVATLAGSATRSENTTIYWPGTTSGPVRCVVARAATPQLGACRGAAELARSRLVARQVPRDALQPGIARTGEVPDRIPGGGRDDELDSVGLHFFQVVRDHRAARRVGRDERPAPPIGVGIARAILIRGGDRKQVYRFRQQRVGHL